MKWILEQDSELQLLLMSRSASYTAASAIGLWMGDLDECFERSVNQESAIEFTTFFILHHFTLPSQHHRTDFKRCISCTADVARRNDVKGTTDTEKETQMSFYLSVWTMSEHMTENCLNKAVYWWKWLKRESRPSFSLFGHHVSFQVAFISSCVFVGDRGRSRK